MVKLARPLRPAAAGAATVPVVAVAAARTRAATRSGCLPGATAGGP